MLNKQTIAAEIRILQSQIAKIMPDSPALFGWAAYSQLDEDGIIRECLLRIADNTHLSRTFVEVGCADGLENNSHLLLLDGFRGVWIDGNQEKISNICKALGGNAFNKLWIVEAMVSLNSAEALGRRAKIFLGVDSLDFLSLDIDGNDWHVLPLFLRVLNPKLVCVEYNAKFPPPTRLVMRYDESHSWEEGDYFGASLQSWVDLLSKQGYTLVCCNLSGANAFFVRNELLQGFTCYPPEQFYQPPRYSLIEASKGHAPSLLWAKQVLQHVDADRARFVPAVLGSTSIQFAIHTATDQFISSDIAQDGVWEPFESKVFCCLCKPADTVLDLGANIGWYSVLAASIVGTAGRVLAFEPDECNARLLEMNMAVSDPHSIVKIYRSAVGDIETEALLYKSETNLGNHCLFSDGSSRESYPVNVTTLDAFFSREHQRLPDIVKSDTQGSEAKIFKGAKELFSRGWRPVMILEFWPFGLNKSGDDPLTFWQELVRLGYKTFEVSENNPQLVPVCIDRLKIRLETDISPSSDGFINLLCIPDGSNRFVFIADLISSVD
jgi:FkbM family methyltransferase